MSADERTCAVVQDLLPLYGEGLVSKETSAFIEDHLAACPRCRAVWDTVRGGEARLSASRNGAEPAPEGDAVRFLRRWRARVRALVAGAAGLVLLAGAVGAVAVWSREPTQAQRYAAFTDTIPGFAASSSVGGVVPLHETVRIGQETVTFKAFYATYLGSYLVFTVQDASGPPLLPYLQPGSPGVPNGHIGIGNLGAPFASTTISKTAIAGYWSFGFTDLSAIPKINVGSDLSLTISLGSASAQKGAVVTLRIPKSATRPHAAVTLRRSVTFQAHGASVRLDSITLSSAGTVIRGAFRGAGVSPGLQLAGCPSFMGHGGCTSAAWTVGKAKDGWRPLLMVLPAPASLPVDAGSVSMALAGIDVDHAWPISRSLSWPVQGLPAPNGVGGKPLLLGYAGKNPVDLAARITATTLSLSVSAGAPGPHAPQTELQKIALRLPDGKTVISGPYGGEQSMSGPESHGLLTGQWDDVFTQQLQPALTAEQLSTPGSAHLSFTVHLFPVQSFPRGTAWQP